MSDLVGNLEDRFSRDEVHHVSMVNVSNILTLIDALFSVRH